MLHFHTHYFSPVCVRVCVCVCVCVQFSILLHSCRDSNFQENRLRRVWFSSFRAWCPVRTHFRYLKPFEVDLDPTTLIYDLKIPMTYLHTKIELPRSKLSNVTALQTDRQTLPNALPYAAFAGG